MSQKTNFKRAREFVEMPEQEEKLPGSEEGELLIRNVTLHRADRSVLYKIPELSVEEPGLILIKGENGCGKSTLFHILSGVFSEEQMQIEENGKVLIPSKSVEEPGLILIKGENGCGKSTLFHILSGVFSEEQMQIEENGKVLIPSKYRNDFSYLFYPNFIFPGTVRENVLCGQEAEPGSYEKIEELL